MKYTPEQQREIGEQAAGKTVASLEHEIGPSGDYWVMTFTDGTEISFRFMSEIGAGSR